MSETLDAATIEGVWRTFLTTGDPPDFVSFPWYDSKHLRWLVRMLPKAPRCRICYFPFHGIGGTFLRVTLGRIPSRLNPQICNECEQFAARYKGGAEIELSMLFADVRGSTGLAEGMSPSAFSALINRFYRASTGVLFRSNALVEKLIGDGVTAFFVPGIAGPEHANVAIEAARSILRVTGHEDPSGPWIPVGVGVHTGIAFVGAVASEDGVVDITALGDAVNTAARLGSEARQGEVIVSEECSVATGSRYNGMESRQLQLKGRTQPVSVRVLEVKPQAGVDMRK